MPEVILQNPGVGRLECAAFPARVNVSRFPFPASHSVDRMRSRRIRRNDGIGSSSGDFGQIVISIVFFVIVLVSAILAVGFACAFVAEIVPPAAVFIFEPAKRIDSVTFHVFPVWLYADGSKRFVHV